MIAEEIFQAARQFFENQYGPPIGEGLKRVVFKDGNEVIKVPRNLNGDFGNCFEAETSNNPNFANCKIDEELSSKLQLNILRMEYVEHVGWSKEADWTWFIDCGQVGKTLDGRLVAYDWEHY